jgi:hypothetical protein
MNAPGEGFDGVLARGVSRRAFLVASGADNFNGALYEAVGGGHMPNVEFAVARGPEPGAPEGTTLAVASRAGRQGAAEPVLDELISWSDHLRMDVDLDVA